MSELYKEVLIVDEDGNPVTVGTPDVSALAKETTLQATNTKLDALATYTDGLEALATSLNGYVDGIEALIGTTNSTLSTTNSTLFTLDGHVDQIEGYTDTLEALIAATNTALTTIQGYVDGLEGLLAAATPAGEAHIGQVGGTTDIVTPAITTSSSAYSSGDVIGGIITLTNAVRVSGGTALLQSVLLKDDLNQKPNLDLYFFNASPSGGTYTDNSGFVWGSGDLAKLIRRVSVSAGDWVTVNSKATLDLTPITKAVKPASGRDLYLIIVTTSTPTYAANATSLLINFGFLQD